MNSDAEMLQAREHLADQIDRLAAMLDECVTLTRAGVPISARSIDRYAAELERLASGRRCATRSCVLGAHRQDGRAVMFIHPVPDRVGRADRGARALPVFGLRNCLFASRHSESVKIRMLPPAVRTYSTLPAAIQL